MEIVLANDFCYFLKSRKKSQVRPLSMVFNDHGIGVDKATMSRGLFMFWIINVVIVICNHVIQSEFYVRKSILIYTVYYKIQKKIEIRFLTGAILSRKLDFQREEKIIPFYS